MKRRPFSLDDLHFERPSICFRIGDAASPTTSTVVNVRAVPQCVGGRIVHELRDLASVNSRSRAECLDEAHERAREHNVVHDSEDSDEVHGDFQADHGCRVHRSGADDQHVCSTLSTKVEMQR